MRNEAPSYQTALLRRQHYFSIGAEVVLTLMVCAFLAYLAYPLSLPSLEGGLAQRYGTHAMAEAWGQLWMSTHDLFSRLDNDQRATRLLRTASIWLPAFGLIGLVLLYCARAGGRWDIGLIILVWSTLAAVWRPFGWSASMGSAGALGGLWLLLQASRRTNTKQDGNPFLPENLTMWNSLVWPGWVLLTGRGWLWIADFAARGPVASLRPGAKYFGLHQADGIFLAYAIVLLAAAKNRSLVRGVARLVTGLSSMWRRPRGPRVVLILAGAVVMGLGWLGHRINPPIPIVHIAGGGMPHVSGELLRLIAGIAISWGGLSLR